MGRDNYYVGSGQVGGFRHKLRQLAVPGSDGVGSKINVLTVEGDRPGPAVGLIASIHGDEHTPTEIVRRVITELDRAQLAGRVDAMPVANPLAFEAMARDTPVDGVNLNRVFPGDLEGTYTHRLAATLTNDFMPGLDYAIDIHAGGRQGWVDYVFGLSTREATYALGVEYIKIGTGLTGTSLGAATEAGVKEAVILEFGGMDCSSGPMVDKGVFCVLNLMRFWGMLPGEVVVPPRQYLIDVKTAVQADKTGIVYRDPENCVIGKEVPKGALLARIVSPYTFEVIEEIRATYERNLILHIPVQDGFVGPGDWMFQWADLDQTEVVDHV